MNEIYKTYERFIEAAKKFPKWSNIKRRPIKSVGGALLHGIIEEIGKVEDAIIEYKKDFFIVNYIGKEDKIIDYLYSAYIGEISDIDNIIIKSPQNLNLTTDVKTFYKESGYCLYQDGYLVIKDKEDSIVYSYNDFDYSSELEKTHIWNVFDDFAWWAGLTRFEDEINKQLLIRTINQFHSRGNSSEDGLKNVIKNVISGSDYIDKDDIIIEQPDEDNFYDKTDAGETIYETISKFNRDIARTKQWDLDYWSNTFCKMGYLPHQWDAPVKQYQDGVGYNNSLYVSRVKDLDVSQKTDVIINGYKQDTEKIEEYVRDNNLTSNISLSMKKYSDIINPVEVQYQITASTLTEIDSPELLFIDSYKTSKRELTYSIDELFASKENINIIPRNKLKSNEQYVLKILPKEQDFSTMEISECQLKHKNGSINLLTPKGSFGYDTKNLFKNKAVLFHADSLGDFNGTSNLSDYRYGGLVVTNQNEPATCTIDVSGLTKNKAQSLVISTSCELFDITNNPSYIKAEDFSFKDGIYTSGTSTITPSILTIELPCKDLEFSLEKEGSALSSAYVTIETYINGKLDNNNSYYNVNTANFKTYKLKQYNLNQVKIIIKRNTKTAVKISDIKVNQYKITTVTSKEIDISPVAKESVILPQCNDAHYYVDISIQNYGQTAPVINCVHIGANLNILTATYTVDINTTGLTDPELIIKCNCRTDLYLKKDQNNPVDFSPYNLYTNNTTEYQAIYLDTSCFKEIYYSSPEIKYLNKKPYISLKPGNSIDSIIIYGDNEKLLERKTLKDIVKTSLGDKVYTNKNIKSLVLKKTNDTEKQLFITHDNCSSYDADKFRVWSNKYKNLEYCFVSNLDKGVENINNTYSGNFEYVYFYDKDSQTSIAYNRQTVVKNVTDDISIIKNFSPVLKSFEKKLFIISQVTNSNSKYDFNVSFIDDSNFSTTSSKKIKIKCLTDLVNTESFSVDYKNINKDFILSNNIPLSKTITIGNEEVELARYIITPPEDMKVIYENVSVIQERDENGDVIYIEEDGFNKLLYSNVVKIDKVFAGKNLLSESDYTVLKEPGIIKWDNSNNTGKVLKIVYTYQEPKYLAYKDSSHLYKKVGYNIDAFKKIKTTTLDDYKVTDLSDGDIVEINYNYFQEKPDKISVICSNPCYSGQISDKHVIVKKIAEDDSIVVHSGYYYIDGDEYYYFADKQKINVNKNEGVEFFNVEKKYNLIFKKESVNFLRNSKMLCNSMNVHCITNFNEYKNVPNVSYLESTGLCDNFTNWKSYSMNVFISTSGGISFYPLDTTFGYAILDITKALGNEKAKLYCEHESGLKLYIGEEALIDGHQVSKVFNINKLAPLEKFNSSVSYYNCSKAKPEELRYYLVVKGTGILSRIMVNDNDNCIQDLKSTVEKLGFSFKENPVPNTEIRVDFTPTGMIFDNTELGKDWILRTASSADWGITKLTDINLEKVEKNGFLYRFDSLVSSKDKASITTLPIELKSNSFIQRLYIKINDLNLYKFDIEVYGCNTEKGEYTKLFKGNSDALFSIYSDNFPKYIKIMVTTDEDSIISHLEVLALYRETNIGPGVTDYITGSCTTKVYNLIDAANYMLKSVEYESNSSDKINIYIRGLKVSDSDNVWTEWYELDSNHIFKNYRYFQFKVYIPNPNIEVKVKSFIFEIEEG